MKYENNSAFHHEEIGLIEIVGFFIRIKKFILFGFLFGVSIAAFYSFRLTDRVIPFGDYLYIIQPSYSSAIEGDVKEYKIDLSSFAQATAFYQGFKSSSQDMSEILKESGYSFIDFFNQQKELAVKKELEFKPLVYIEDIDHPTSGFVYSINVHIKKPYNRAGQEMVNKAITAGLKALTISINDSIKKRFEGFAARHKHLIDAVINFRASESFGKIKAEELNLELVEGIVKMELYSIGSFLDKNIKRTSSLIANSLNSSLFRNSPQDIWQDIEKYNYLLEKYNFLSEIDSLLRQIILLKEKKDIPEKLAAEITAKAIAIKEVYSNSGVFKKLSLYSKAPVIKDVTILNNQYIPEKNVYSNKKVLIVWVIAMIAGLGLGTLLGGIKELIRADIKNSSKIMGES